MDGFSVAMGVAGTALGLGLLFTRQKSQSLERFLPHMVALGAGMLLAVNFSEFMPRFLHQKNPWAPGLMFSGIIFVILAEKFISPLFSRYSSHSCGHHHDHNLDHSPSIISRQAACSSIGCILVCAFFDGVSIPVAFRVNGPTGWVVGSSLFLHTIPEGALAASIARVGGLTRRESQVGVYLVTGAILLGALFSTSLSWLFDFQRWVLPLVSGVLIYVALGHLLPAVLRTRFGLYGVVIGALFIYLLELAHIFPGGHLHHP